MPSRHSRNHTFTTAKSAWKVTEKAAIGLARWATTDHTGTVKMLADRPSSDSTPPQYRQHQGLLSICRG